MRRSGWLLVLVAAGVMVSLVNVSEHRLLAADRIDPARQRLDPETERIVQGFKINPVPLHFSKINRDLVGLGSYLVNSSGCNDCHTNPSYAAGHDPFLGEPEQVNVDGFLAGGQAFGPFLSRNLTPDEHGNPGGLTWEQFRNAIRTGIDPEHAHPDMGPLLQVMPWPVFSKKTDHELFAIYQYLRAIPSLPGNPGEE